MSTTKRIAQIAHLKPSAVDAYKQCHAAVWPEVLQQIQECNIRDCTPPTCSPKRAHDGYDGQAQQTNPLLLLSLADTIFFDNDRTIFATSKYVGHDWDADMRRMSENPKVREWWALTDGMQVFPLLLSFLILFYLFCIVCSMLIWQ